MATSTQDFGLTLAGSFPSRQIDLAHEDPFQLGAVLVEPSRLRLSRRGYGDLTVEPRVMQVLSALFEAHGKVVGRDDLIERCWAGRIVGENSINRVISILRRTAENIGKDSYAIETVPKVGYRLNASGPVALAETEQALPDPCTEGGGASRTNFSRRRMIGGVAAAGVGGLVAAGAIIAAPFAFPTLREGLSPLFGGHVPTPEARELYDAGMRAQYFGPNAMSEQAELFFRRAAQADPDWADAWGALAMSYRYLSYDDSQTDQWRLVEQTRAAANRALELDPHNAEALVALTLIRPPFGRWIETEREYTRLLKQFPDSFALRDHYEQLLRDLGRFDEAVEQSAISVANQPLIPSTSVGHAISLWGAGRLQEADAEIERGFRLFARCTIVWFTRVDFLTYNGRASEALGLALDRASWPTDMPDFLFERRKLTAKAVLTRAQEDIDSVLRAIDIYVGRCLSGHPFTIDPAWPVPFLSMIGAIDRAFDILESYYLWRGPLAPPGHAGKGPLSRRETAWLFMPTLANVRRDRRFAPLVEAIGLTAQFRASGKWPDSWQPRP